VPPVTSIVAIDVANTHGARNQAVNPPSRRNDRSRSRVQCWRSFIAHRVVPISGRVTMPPGIKCHGSCRGDGGQTIGNCRHLRRKWRKYIIPEHLWVNIRFGLWIAIDIANGYG
jgi:hypothetical protein